MEIYFSPAFTTSTRAIRSASVSTKTSRLHTAGSLMYGLPVDIYGRQPERPAAGHPRPPRAADSLHRGHHARLRDYRANRADFRRGAEGRGRLALPCTPSHDRGRLGQVDLGPV